jgi:mycofactocin system glycosyltransferase
VIGAYEAARSPLDLGAEPGPVRPGSRVSYVPAAALVCRVGPLAALGGFDESLRTGEDVDMVWRLAAAGWRCRYEPAAEVWHEVRPSLRALAAQRLSYGRAAAPLAARHGDAVAPARLTLSAAAAWSLALVGLPSLGAAVAATPAAGLARRARLPLLDAARLTLAGAQSAGEQLAAATTRPWLPLAVAVSVRSRRTRRWLMLAVAVPAARDWLRLRPALDPVRFAALRLLDDAAYGAGVWQGCLRERTLRPLLPALVRPARRS